MTISFPEPGQRNPPRSVSGLFNRAMTQLRQENYAGALDDLSRVIEREPGNSTAWYFRGLVMGIMGHVEASLSDMDKALQIMPRYPEALALRANLLNQLGRFDEAAEAAQAALEITPENRDARHTLSLARAKLNDPVGALKDVELLLKEDRNNPMLLNNHAGLLNNLGRYEEALADADRALSLLPGIAALYSTRAEAKRGLNDYRGALLDHHEAIKLQPELAALYEERAKTYDVLEDPTNAELDRRQARELREQKPDGQHLAMIPTTAKRQPRRNNLARLLPILLLLALIIGPRIVSSLQKSQTTTTTQAEAEQQISELTKQLASTPDDVTLLLGRGYLYLSRGRLTSAAQDFDKAIQLSPQNAEAFAGRGVVYARYGQSDKAVEYFKKALALDPGIDEDHTLSDYISNFETK